MAGKTKGSARSAVTGRYVKPGYAAKNPKTTVVESRKPSSSGKGSKKC